MARLRYQCRSCAKRGKGGFFSLKEKDEAALKEIKCPYCGSLNVKLLG